MDLILQKEIVLVVQLASMVTVESEVPNRRPRIIVDQRIVFFVVIVSAVLFGSHVCMCSMAAAEIDSCMFGVVFVVLSCVATICLVCHVRNIARGKHKWG